MQPPDVMFLEVLLVAVGMIAFGLLIPSVSVLLWFGIAIGVGITGWWIVSEVRRHGTQY